MLRHTLVAASLALGLFGAASARAEDEQVPRVARKTFQADAKLAVVETAACSLHPVAMVGNFARALDVRIDQRPCATTKPPEGALVLVVRITPWDAARQVVTLEAAAPDAASFDDVRALVDETALELKAKLSVPPSVPQNDPTAPSRRWYGGQILAADGVILAGTSVVALALAAGGAGEAVSILFPLSVGSIAFAGPVVHWSHGHNARGNAVLGATFGVAALSALAGVGITCASGGCSGDFGWIGTAVGIAMGATVGVLGSAIVDIATSYEGQPPAVAPVVSLQHDRAFVGVRGAF